MLTNIDQGSLRGRNMINIHNPLTALAYSVGTSLAVIAKQTLLTTQLHLAV